MDTPLLVFNIDKWAYMDWNLQDIFKIIFKEQEGSIFGFNYPGKCQSFELTSIFDF